MASTTPGHRGRFDGFDVVAQADHWDDETRAVVFSRLASQPPLAFFDATEEPTARALLDRLLAQDDEPKIPLLELIDERLIHHDGDGYRYADMPEDWDAWKRSIAALDDDAQHAHGAPFWALDRRVQKKLIDDVRTAPDRWHGLPGKRTFALWMRYAITAFYSHPWAWNEIGFPGPAYPRGYKTFAVGRREPFEVAEHDPRDPIPWMDKVEAVLAEHADDRTGSDGD
jgi:hypothetical protein